ncbi:MAG: hypothetical protein KAI88_05150 [Nitrosomonadaceae bacterium]|nr:hypothetical protein [Nitrosomonadaceae bacterium]
MTDKTMELSFKKPHEEQCILEVKCADRTYEFKCQNSSPMGEMHDAIMQLKSYCVDRMLEAHKLHEEEAEAHKKRQEESQEEE